jgi:serine/threonine protein kinase
MAQAGQTIGGRYRLAQLLGEGGMGEVWKARDEKLEVDVAVKQVRLDPHASPGERAKAIAYADSEAKNAAALRDHPNVVTVYDVVTEAGTPWLVMRLVEGRSVEQMLETGKGGKQVRLHPDEAGRIASGVLAALKAAHTAKPQIIHRDVKPANIMVARDGHVLLTDFGISKDPSSSTRRTSTGVVVGSVAYMAPERFEDGPDGPAVDLWAVGVTLFEMTEGFSPFKRGTNLATMNAIGNEPAPPAKHAGPLAPLIAALLDKNPKRRPDAERALAMLRGRGGEPTQTVKQPARQKTAEPKKSKPARSPFFFIMTTIPIGTLLVGIGGVLLWALGGLIGDSFHGRSSHNGLPAVDCTVSSSIAQQFALPRSGGRVTENGDPGCEWAGTSSFLTLIDSAGVPDPGSQKPADIGIPDSYEWAEDFTCTIFWKTSFGSYRVEWQNTAFIGKATLLCPTAENVAKQLYPSLKH